MYLPINTPAGKNSKNPTTQKIACATMSFWYGSNGKSLPKDSWPVAIGVVLGWAALGVFCFVRSSWPVPNSRCCCKMASPAAEPGFVVPKAKMMFWVLSPLAYPTSNSHQGSFNTTRVHTGIEKANRVLPEVVLRVISIQSSR